MRWYRADDSEVSGTHDTVVRMATNTDWTLLSGESTAPVVKGLLYTQVNKADGVAYFDDLSVTSISQ